MTPEIAIYGAWALWLVSWIAAAGWASSPVKSAGWGREATYRVVQAAGFAALMTFRGWSSGARDTWAFTLYEPLWRLPAEVNWLMVAFGVGGFLFCWWARLHLGRLWSGTVTRKEGHHVVDSGPYAIVRHPIYSGLLAAVIATAAIKATPLAVLGVALISAALVMKGRLEEAFLGEELGREAYASYRRRVPMLVPFGPTPRG